MISLPLLLQPKYRSLINYWRHSKRSSSTLTRDLVIVGFGIALMLGLYFGGQWVAFKAQSGKSYLYFHPSLALGLMLVYLFAMLIFSNAGTAISSLFLAADLDLILSAPTSRMRFFLGKFLDILLGSSWVTMVFILPAIYSFGRFYQAPLWYYPFVLLVLLPYFIIPVAISMIIVTVYCRFVSATRTKEALLLLAGVGAIGGYLLLSLLFADNDQFSFRRTEDIVRLVAILSIPNQPWMPSFWASTCLSEALEPTKATFLPYLIMLWSVALGLLALTYLTVSAFHHEGYSRAQGGRAARKISSRVWQRVVEAVLARYPRRVSAIVIKDWSLFLRDAGQLFQLVMLGGLCLMYFYNFRLLHGIQSELSPEIKRWWGVFLFMTNSSIEAFLITAVGTRFVFQSISLEGRSYWIIQTAPVTIHEFIRIKLWTWCVPIALVLGTVFGIGAHAIGMSGGMVVIKVISSWIICYGVSGLAIGVGAYFANFAWEHSSQLAASFGTLVFMLLSVVLVFLNLSVVGVMLMFQQWKTANPELSANLMGAGILAAFAIFVLLNCVVAARAMELGEKELNRRMD